MAAFIDKEILTATAEYSANFWNAMRCRMRNFDVLKKATDLGIGCSMLPVKDNLQMDAVIGKESVFRNLVSVVTFYGEASTIFAHDCNEMAAWVPKGAAISLARARISPRGFSLPTRGQKSARPPMTCLTMTSSSCISPSRKSIA